MSFVTICVSTSVDQCQTDCTIIPAIPAIIVNATLGIMAAPAVPASFMYANEINILEVYSDKLLEIAQKNALLTWGDGSFTNQFLL